MKVSVVIPTAGRMALLRRCLDALALQTFSGAWEIVVVHDAEGAAPEIPWRHGSAVLRVLSTGGRRGPATARNLGWRSAAGSVIAFTDDDTIPAPDWLKSGLGAFDETVCAVSGRVEVPLPAQPSDYELNEAGLETAEFVTANCLVRREALEAIGGFDERFAIAWREDSDLHFSLLGYAQAHGLKIRKADDAVVVHPVRPAPWTIALSQQRKSLFNALLFKKHPELYRERIQATPPGHYYAAVMGFGALLAGTMVSAPAWQAVGGIVWLLAVSTVYASRHRRTFDLRHEAQLAATSLLIPFLSVYWRLRGAVRFRVWFF